MKIYLASPFFEGNEIEYVKKAEQILRGRGFDVFSPREYTAPEFERGSRAWSEAIFKIDVEGIRKSDVVVMLYHGNYSDSGTAWECGYAFGTGKPVVCVQLGGVSNLMVHESVKANITIENLEKYDFERLPKVQYEGEML